MSWGKKESTDFLMLEIAYGLGLVLGYETFFILELPGKGTGKSLQNAQMSSPS